MKVRIEPGSLLYKILFFFVSFFLKIWIFTLRVKTQDPLKVNSAEYTGNYILTMWHNRIVTITPLFVKSVRLRFHAMASRSKDGQIISDFLNSYGVVTIRGSANKDGRAKGGAVALINCIKTLKAGHIVCVTPDGPRGPKYEVQPGALIMAAKSKLPILPVSVNYHSYWQLKSWDRLQIPKPFSRVDFVFGDLLHFEGPMGKEELVVGKQKLRDAMMAITVDKTTKDED